MDASRIRSGGGIAHIKGILNSYNPTSLGFKRVYIWAIRGVVETLPEYPWLIKIPFKFEESNILIQLFWQRYVLPRLCFRYKVDCLINLDAGSIARYSKMITISQDLLSYEHGQMKKYFFSYKWIRLFILRYVQIYTLRASVGNIYLTKYAKDTLESYTGHTRESCIIPHGIDDINFGTYTPFIEKESYSVVYVSNIAPYKNQLNVISAIDKLYDMNFRIQLTMIGGGAESRYKRVVNSQIKKLKNKGIHIDSFDFLSRDRVATLVNQHDIFLFASSCENMPVTLLEGMKSGKPILCSSRGPMPEVLGKYGIYFDPEDVDSIVESFINFKKTSVFSKNKMIQGALSTSEKYTWTKSAEKMWFFIKKISSYGE